MATKIDDPISVNAMLQGNLFERLRFAYLANPTDFIKMFNDVGIAVDKNNIFNELLTLETFHKKGFDTKGDLKNTKGEKIVFDIRKMSDSLVPTNSNIVVY